MFAQWPLIWYLFSASVWHCCSKLILSICSTALWRLVLLTGRNLTISTPTWYSDELLSPRMIYTRNSQIRERFVVYNKIANCCTHHLLSSPMSAKPPPTGSVYSLTCSPSKNRAWHKLDLLSGHLISPYAILSSVSALTSDLLAIRFSARSKAYNVLWSYNANR